MPCSAGDWPIMVVYWLCARPGQASEQWEAGSRDRSVSNVMLVRLEWEDLPGLLSRGGMAAIRRGLRPRQYCSHRGSATRRNVFLSTGIYGGKNSEGREKGKCQLGNNDCIVIVDYISSTSSVLYSEKQETDKVRAEMPQSGTEVRP